MSVDVALVAFAFGLGVGTFFSPCSVGLLPAFAAYHLGGTTGAGRVGGAPAVMAGVRFGAAAAAGVLILFVGAGAVVFGIRARVDVPSALLAEGFALLAMTVGFVVVALGVAVMAGRGPAWTVPVTAPKGRGASAMFAFGVLYAVASLGCTLPLFFALIVQVLLQGLVGGLVLFAAFASAVAVLLFAASIALAVARDAVRTGLRRIMPYVKPFSGLVMVLAGGYVVVYYATVPV